MDRLCNGASTWRSRPCSVSHCRVMYEGAPGLNKTDDGGEARSGCSQIAHSSAPLAPWPNSPGTVTTLRRLPGRGRAGDPRPRATKPQPATSGHQCGLFQASSRRTARQVDIIGRASRVISSRPLAFPSVVSLPAQSLARKATSNKQRPDLPIASLRVVTCCTALFIRRREDPTTESSHACTCCTRRSSSSEAQLHCCTTTNGRRSGLSPATTTQRLGWRPVRHAVNKGP